MLPVGSSRKSCCATFKGQPTGAVRRHARARRTPKPAEGGRVPNTMGCVPAYLKCVPAYPGCAPQRPIKQGANLECEPAYPGCEPKKNGCNWRIRALLPPAYCNRPEGPKERSSHRCMCAGRNQICRNTHYSSPPLWLGPKFFTVLRRIRPTSFVNPSEASRTGCAVSL